jgi:hypothetical protein
MGKVVRHIYEIPRLASPRLASIQSNSKFVYGAGVSDSRTVTLFIYSILKVLVFLFIVSSLGELLESWSFVCRRHLINGNPLWFGVAFNGCCLLLLLLLWR